MPQKEDELIDLQAPQELTEQLSIALQKAYLCLTLAKTCFQYLGFGWQWLACLIRLILFSALLSPGIFLTSLFYCFSTRIHRNVWYSREARNLLDIYVPYRHHFKNGRLPVLIYVTGGAYMIGYKAWGAVLARRLSQCGVITCCLDYRNFPQASIDDMVGDVQRGIGWVLNRIEGFGGDSSQVYLMGQSCGGHLAALALIWQHQNSASISASNGPVHSEMWSWQPSQIQGFVGFCSPYNIEVMQQHFQKRGLAPRLLRGIFQPSLSLDTDQISFSRVCPVSHLNSGSARCLRRHGIAVELKVYQSATHTSKLIEDPFRGGTDDVVSDVLRFMRLKIPDNVQFWPLVPFPYIITALANWVCPF